MKKITKKILASALALAMTVAGSVVTFAEGEIPTGTASVVSDGQTVTVTVSASGDFKNGFDYGVAYDGSKVTVEDLVLADEFAAFLKSGQGIDQQRVFQDTEYAVLGGTIAGEDKLGNKVPTDYSGVVGSVTFKVKDGVDASTAEFVLVTNSSPAAKANPGVKMMDIVKDPSKVPAGVVVGNATTPEIKTEAPAPTDNNPTEAPAPTDNNPTEAPAPTDNQGGSTGGDQQPGGSTGGDQQGGSNNTQNPVVPTTTTAAPAAPVNTTAAKSKSTKAAKTGDAGVVLPIVAICGAAAAVAVASKKKVED